MSTLIDHPAKAVVLAAITVSQDEAVRLSGLSAKTLARRHAGGEPTGRLTCGRRVLFLRAQIERWLASLAAAN